jgi:hypothetical protein
MYTKLSKVGCLVAPRDYWLLTPKQKKDMCNGCGPKGGFWHRLLSAGIPDNLCGLSIKEACNIHDFCWALHEMPKKQVDNLFMDNMSALIDEEGGALAGLRHWMAFHYWLAVRSFKRK